MTDDEGITLPGQGGHGFASGLWADHVREANFVSAFNYLSLLWDADKAGEIVDRLRAGDVKGRKAVDLLRASRQDPAPLHDPSGLKHLRALAKGKKFSPVLCVSIDVGLVVADGFHRISVAYHLDPFDMVPVVLV